MFLKKFVKDPRLNGFFKQIDSGQYLFRQGAKGNSMFVIVHGMIQLFDESEEIQHLVGTFGPGQFFGEKSMLSNSSYQRMFSALAQTKTILMEVALKDIPKIQLVIPDFMLHLFQAATQRLDRSYYLIRILRTENDLHKLIHCILYFYRYPGLEKEYAELIPMTREDLQYLIHMDEGRLEKCLELLVEWQILTKLPSDSFLLKNENDLLRAMPDLEEKLAA